MTIIPVLLNEQIHSRALVKASAIGTDSAAMPPGLLYAPLTDEMNRWINRIWDSTEEAVRRACSEGMTIAKQYIDNVAVLLAQLQKDFSNRADEVRSVIAARLNAYIRDVIDAALERVSASITVGGTTFRMKSVRIDQQISVSGALKASLESICEFVAQGQLSLAAEYTQE